MLNYIPNGNGENSEESSSHSDFDYATKDGVEYINSGADLKPEELLKIPSKLEKEITEKESDPTKL